jgi:hypothetical protein
VFHWPLLTNSNSVVKARAAFEIEAAEVAANAGQGKPRNSGRVSKRTNSAAPPWLIPTQVASGFRRPVGCRGILEWGFDGAADGPLRAGPTRRDGKWLAL